MKSNRLSHLSCGEEFPTEAQKQARAELEAEQDKMVDEILSEEEMRLRGEKLARVFKLNTLKGYDPPRFEITHGDKSGIGIYRTCLDLLGLD